LGRQRRSSWKGEPTTPKMVTCRTGERRFWAERRLSIFSHLRQSQREHAGGRGPEPKLLALFVAAKLRVSAHPAVARSNNKIAREHRLPGDSLCTSLFPCGPDASGGRRRPQGAARGGWSSCPTPFHPETHQLTGDLGDNVGRRFRRLRHLPTAGRASASMGAGTPKGSF
jgi:hypothetical protein